MKKTIIILALVLVTGRASLNAQSTAKKVETDVKTATKKAGDKTAEIASKGKAAVIDKVYKGKKGTNGQTIYIDRHSKYYWINKKGHKVYVTKNDLSDQKTKNEPQNTD